MSEIKLNAWRVEIIESEAGWGSKVDEVKFFDSKQSAEDFVKSYNLEYNNCATGNEDWCMIAQYCGKV